MDQKETFSYTYSAQENSEIQQIRHKYLPREESKLEELKRLDALVQTSGTMESLIVGILGCLIFGTGMCLAMEVIGNAVWLGVLLGLIGSVAIICAYPVYRKVFEKTKQKYVTRILELADQLQQ